MKTARKVIGYVRVSGQASHANGASIPAQRARIRALYPRAEIVQEAGARSAGSLKGRAVLQRVLDEIDKGNVAALVCAKLDRVARNVRDGYDIVDKCKRTGTAFHAIDSGVHVGGASGVTDACSDMICNLLFSFAQLEKGLASERKIDSNAYRREQGRPTGRIPFGFSAPRVRRADGTVTTGYLKPNPKEQAALAHMKRMRAQKIPLRDIAAWLTDEGYVPRYGKNSARWQASTIRYILNKKPRVLRRPNAPHALGA